MKFVTYDRNQPAAVSGLAAINHLPLYQSAWVEEDGRFVDIASAYKWFCQSRGLTQNAEWKATWSDLNKLVRDWTQGDRWQRIAELRDAWREACADDEETALGCILQPTDILLKPPVYPHTFRDFYAFEKHVQTCRAKRGLEMVREWYDFPVFYFSNPLSFLGSGEPVSAPRGSNELDFELEVACVLGKPGISILTEDADSHIAGYVILNDWSARDIQRNEVKVGLGPAKGKDFATSFGPYFVTPDELSDVAEHTSRGVRHQLSMQAEVNGKVISSGNLYDLHYTFAEMIERASADVHMYAGDVIGSGTVGTGCILEVGTDVQPWLVPGDIVRLSVERLGLLQTPIESRL
jgi:fumarylacetoacetate (FAA) hydrolase